MEYNNLNSFYRLKISLLDKKNYNILKTDKFLRHLFTFKFIVPTYKYK